MKKFFFGIALMICCGCLFAQKSTSSDQTPFRETFWYLKTIDGKAINKTNDIEPYIVFDKSNTYYGNLGCNSYFGKYSVSSKKVKLKYSGATKKLCAEMESEEQFLKALKMPVTHYLIENNTLTLLLNGKPYMTFVAGPTPQSGDKTNINSIEREEQEYNDKGERETQREDLGDGFGE
ncbi:MAG: META domain-containing protein [Bacteroidales bacterium]|nr:META domain-containing protein [Bacteroidales bacterium]